MLSTYPSNLKIVVIGAGNVAFHLSRSLYSAGHVITQVIGKSSQNAKELSLLVGGKYSNNINDINQNADLYIIAVPDGAIGEIVKSIPNLNGVVVHTSGSTPLENLSEISPKFGVFYPFQTFSRSRDLNLKDVPFLIEASTLEVKDLLFKVAESIEAVPIEMESETRKWLHLSGVFSCNFVNHMLTISQMISEESGFDFNLLKPLIKETIAKAMDSNPASCQTGPAIRGDAETIKKHVGMLSNVDDELRDMYMSISESIWTLHNQNEQ